MSDNFQQTVNLRERMEQLKQQKLRANKPSSPPSSQIGRFLEKKATEGFPPAANKAEGIDDVYKNGGADLAEPDLKKISRPAIKKLEPQLVRKIITSALIIIVGIAVIWGIVQYNKRSGEKVAAAPKWYAVKLLNNEIYYGQIADTAADPVIIANVYYDYDQINKKEGEASPTGNLRLVKRGKETYGPEGSMNIVRAQVVYMEPLKEDSKVLKAILEYEKK